MMPYKAFVSTLHAGDVVGYLRTKLDTECGGSHDPLPKEKLIESLQGKDALVAVLEDRIDEQLLASCPQLKVVGNVAVGYDNIDIAAASRHGVLVCNTPGVLDDTTADLAFCLLLTVARRVVESDRFVRDGKWRKWTSDLFLGADVHGKTLGIIGFGRIGQTVARRASGFNMRILYHQRHRADETVEAAYQAQYVDLSTLLRKCDFISVHCPLNEQTFHLLSAAEFDQMQPHAVLVNTSRGPVVDEAALVQALQQGLIAGAGLDVFEQEPAVSQQLLSMPNVVLTPHIGSASVETRAAMAKLAADGVLTALSGQLPKNAVNPDAWTAFVARLSASEQKV